MIIGSFPDDAAAAELISVVDPTCCVVCVWAAGVPGSPLHATRGAVVSQGSTLTFFLMQRFVLCAAVDRWNKESAKKRRMTWFLSWGGAVNKVKISFTRLCFCFLLLDFSSSIILEPGRVDVCSPNRWRTRIKHQTYNSVSKFFSQYDCVGKMICKNQPSFDIKGSVRPQIIILYLFLFVRSLLEPKDSSFSNKKWQKKKLKQQILTV